MAEKRVQRRLAAILATDVVGYSRLMEQDEAGTLARLKARRKEVLEPLVARHRGRIFKVMGDGALVEFSSAVDAVECAVQLQEGMASANGAVPEDRRIVLRIGVNLGDVMVERSDLYGDGVNIAARLEAIAEPGGICISAKVHNEVRRKSPLDCEDLGEQQLKNIAAPVHVYNVRLTGPAAPAPRGLALPDKPSIAVLPFNNMSGDPEQEYFADGMVEDIITDLSRFRNLFVIARNSSFTYKGRAVDVKQVGRELGVRYVLEGSVRKAANRLRITGQLIDASTGAHLWAERFDGGLEDVFELQERMASSVIGAIAPKLEQAEIARARGKPTGSLDAYDYYLRGMESVYRWTKEGAEEALRLYYRAIELDPEFAAAYGMAAWCYYWRMVNSWMTSRRQENVEVVRLARKAADLGKDDAVALSFGGFAIGYVAGELVEGAALVDRAIALNPNLAAAWCASGLLKTRLGDPDLGIEHLANAMRLSPLDPLTTFMENFTAIAHFYADRHDKAWPLAEKVVRKQPNYLGALRVAAASNACAGRLEEARSFIARALQLDPEMRLSNLRDRIGWHTPKDFAKLVGALRKAGLPE
jgi:TolB-like protein